ncbi:hypothetical protein [Iningainema tapete]|uniref:Uncharacterized protein n=1 Tax=Iningainema tapete BLCC-T55 TaxID=2748662 RepID=A0A8J6XKR2_9CYAN|nr:hypothetical protein [Iningainema tapete]MBD2778029.1 hypothetical protein [Iningainema tapete BLCC-T55]
MSAQASDKSFIAANVSPDDKYQQSRSQLRLTEVSPIGKAWDKHRANADQVSEYYASAVEGCFHSYAMRVRMCSDTYFSNDTAFVFQSWLSFPCQVGSIMAAVLTD